MHLTQVDRELMTSFVCLFLYFPHKNASFLTGEKIKGKEQWEGEVTETNRSQSGIRSRGTDGSPPDQLKGKPSTIWNSGRQPLKSALPSGVTGGIW